ncbi:MAG: fibronectin type III domain-containing protein [candidate division Zixibacteria bacterium]|nr:fibronectin type III domain-containing protein [candidate division Zixibacteria bacterium]
MMKKILFTVCSLVLLAAGCSRQIDSKTPLQSLPDPLRAPINVTILLNDREVTLTWEMSDSDRVARFRVYAAEAGATDYILRDSTVTYSTTITGLAVNRTYFFRVAAVDPSGIEGERSSPVSSEIGLFSIRIEGDDEYINHREVTVQVNTSISASHVILSEDSLFIDADYRPFSSNISFNLSGGDGLKTVYAGFIFTDGTRSNRPVSDDIVLDTRSEIDSVFFTPYGQTFAVGDMVTLGLDGGDFGPDSRELDGKAYVLFGPADSVKLYDDGTSGDMTADDGIYTVDYYLPEGLNLIDTQLTGHFIDAAGNFASKISDSVIAFVNVPPVAVVLAGNTSGSETIHLSWSRNNDVDFESYRLFRDNSALADPPSASLMITYINDRNITSFDDYAAASGTYHYKVYVYDRSGAATGSNEVVITR